MAEKEERILFARSTDYTITDTAEGALFDGKIAPHCANVFTRQEAIEKTAKANWIATVCAKNQCVPIDITKEQRDEEWEKLRIDYKKVYYAGAEAALNALLEGKGQEDLL